MYYVYFNTASGSYNIRTNKGTRSRWSNNFRSCLASADNMLKVSSLPDTAILLYQGTTLPTPESNPELFL